MGQTTQNEKTWAVVESDQGARQQGTDSGLLLLFVGNEDEARAFARAVGEADELTWDEDDQSWRDEEGFRFVAVRSC